MRYFLATLRDVLKVAMASSGAENPA